MSQSLSTHVLCDLIHSRFRHCRLLTFYLQTPLSTLLSQHLKPDASHTEVGISAPLPPQPAPSIASSLSLKGTSVQGKTMASSFAPLSLTLCTSPLGSSLEINRENGPLHCGHPAYNPSLCASGLAYGPSLALPSSLLQLYNLIFNTAVRGVLQKGFKCLLWQHMY